MSAVPMVPPAPPRFSMTIDWPSRSPSFCATMRATMSVEPPGGKGTIRRIGFAGQAWADAAPGCSSAAAHRVANTSALIVIPASFYRLLAEPQPLRAFGIELDLALHERVHVVGADIH